MAFILRQFPKKLSVTPGGARVKPKALAAFFLVLPHALFDRGEVLVKRLQ